MNSQITTLDPVTPINAKTILAQEGFACSVLTLAPGDETPLREARDVERHLLFVVEGDITVRFDDVNTILNKDAALLIPKGRAHLIAGGKTGWSKVLRVDVPPRQIVQPEIVFFAR